METRTYNSKVDWWVGAVVVFSAAVCLAGPLIDGEFLWVGIGLAVVVSALEDRDTFITHLKTINPNINIKKL